MISILITIKKTYSCRFVGLLLMLVMSILSVSGCVSNNSSSTGQKVEPHANEKERTIVRTTPSLRETAVSGDVGRWAVVVGISDYKYDKSWNPGMGFPDLQYAHRDAEAFANFLISPRGGAFPRDHVRLLVDEQATIKKICVAIGDFLARSLEEDIVIIYFAGHGAPDPVNPQNIFLICHDTEPGSFMGTAYPMWAIDDAIKRAIHAKRIFVLADACHSAALGGVRSGNTSDKINAYMSKLAQSREGVTKITASRANEMSIEKNFPEGGHGLGCRKIILVPNFNRRFWILYLWMS